MNESRDGDATRRQPRSRGALVALAALLGFAFVGLCALGIWQVQRLSWKVDLIERVEARVHAAPVDAPARDEWSRISAARDEYRHVRLDGHFLPGRDTRVQAVTALGPGFWVLSPFQTGDGTIVLINRGFVPGDWGGDELSSAPTQVTGLLRLSEPKGGFLRHNDPATQHWYSRDVQAIADAQNLQSVAPYFVDADASAGPGESAWPRAGLTVTRFSNNHLGYALTWFTLALMVAGAAVYLAREELKLRRATVR